MITVTSCYRQLAGRLPLIPIRVSLLPSGYEYPAFGFDEWVRRNQLHRSAFGRSARAGMRRACSAARTRELKHEN
jgi:hypothetical protein